MDPILANSWIFYAVLIILGLVLGSFFNVCIYRLPRNESLIWPGSHCPHCRHPLAPKDNIPLVSFLLLKGACRYCHAPIALRYPLVELLTALLLVLLGWRFGLSWALGQNALLACALLVVSFIDLDQRIIPDEISCPGMAIGLLLSIGLGFPGWKSSVFGLLLGGGVLYLLAWGYELATKKEGLGGGDIKLLAMIGAFVGWQGVLVTIFMGSLLGTLVGLLLMLIWKKERTHAIPFGPFLSLGALIFIFLGDRLIAWYLG